MQTLRFSHTHIYQGALARADAPLAGRGETACLVEFADGVQVRARLTGEGDALCLAVPAYRTARGTRIAARRWRFAAAPGDGPTLRVTARAADPD